MQSILDSGATLTSRTTYRTATLADLQAITSVLQAAELPAREIEPFIDTFLVAEKDGMVVACGGIEMHADTAVIRSVAVNESVRGQGIGRRLSLQLILQALGRGANDLYLFTADAWAFWQKLGFANIGLEDWRLPARQSWQYEYVSRHEKWARSIGLRTMWMPASQHNGGSAAEE